MAFLYAASMGRVALSQILAQACEAHLPGCAHQENEGNFYTSATGAANCASYNRA